MAAGVSHARIQRWCGVGRLSRVHAGVYALGYRHAEPVARAMAAVLACGPGAVLSHESAAALYGWRRWPQVPEVTAAWERRRLGIKTHRTRSLPRQEVTRQLGVPVTRPERTIREIEARLTRKQFTRMVKDAWQEHRLDKGAVTRLLGLPRGADPVGVRGGVPTVLPAFRSAEGSDARDRAVRITWDRLQETRRARRHVSSGSWRVASGS